MKLQQQKENFTNNLIEYFLKKINTPTDKIAKYTSLIDKELKKQAPSLKEIQKLNHLIKQNNYLLFLTKNILNYLLKINKRTFTPSKEEIKLISVINYAYKPLKDFFKNKIKIQLKSQKILQESITTDKKLLGLMFQVMFYDLLKYTDSDIFLNISCDEEIKIKINFKNPKHPFDFTTGFKNSKEIELNADMFFVSKIARILNIQITAKEEEIEIVFNKK
jgi:hypothetical protein